MTAWWKQYAVIVDRSAEDCECEHHPNRTLWGEE